MSLPVSALWVVRNEEEELPRSILSVRAWAAELVVVVDDRSIDGTAAVAHELGAVVLVQPFAGMGEQRNLGLARCTHDWVMVLDADERATSDLGRGVAVALKHMEHPAYAVRRFNLALGRRVRFGDWGSDLVVRLLHRREVSFSTDPVHPVAVNAAAGRIREGALEHATLRSVQQYVPKLQDYAVRGAAALARRNRRIRWWYPLARAEWRFLRAYFLRAGFLDGPRGLLVAVLAAHGTFLKWSVAWDEQRRRLGT